MELSDQSPPSNNFTMTAETAGANNSVLDQIMQMKQRRLKILHEFNKEHEDEFIPLMKEVQENVKKKETAPKVKRKSEVSEPTPVRRSQRISSKAEEDQQPRIIETQRVSVERPPNDYGHMPGIEVGHHWETRMECSYDGVHRPTVAGIHAGPKGAYSIALSGGYPEDVDEGHTFTYTGAGGRDLKGTAMKPKNLRTAPQTKNQELEGVNYSLVRSIETGLPVRVIRGYKSDSVFAPESGYRYDGLYKVVKYWEDFGKTGFRIYRFRMVRLENQPPPPWEQPTKPKKYYRSVDNENTDPNSKVLDGEGSDDSSNLQNNNNHYSDDQSEVNSVDSKNENELDDEINNCKEKLSRSSVHSSDFYEKLEENSAEFSFLGWD